jgi:hypothetical protein
MSGNSEIRSFETNQSTLILDSHSQYSTSELRWSPIDVSNQGRVRLYASTDRIAHYKYA